MKQVFLLRIHRSASELHHVQKMHHDYTHRLHVVVTTYDLLSPQLLAVFPPHLCVFDECHTIKNPATKRYARATKIPHHVPLIGLSGTLNANNPESDLRVLCDLFVGFVPSPDEMPLFVIRARTTDPDVVAATSASGPTVSVQPSRPFAIRQCSAVFVSI